MIRKIIEKSCLYVNSKCPDKDVDVTILLKEIQEELIKVFPETEHDPKDCLQCEKINQYRQEAIEGIKRITG